MPSNQTANYQLNQWAATDQVSRTDFNADNAKIDAAIKAEADALEASITAVMDSIPRLVTGTYEGTGTTTPLHISLGFRPKMVFVRAGSLHDAYSNGNARIFIEGATIEFSTNGYQYIRDAGRGGALEDNGFYLEIGNNCPFNVAGETDHYWAIR